MEGRLHPLEPGRTGESSSVATTCQGQFRPQLPRASLRRRRRHRPLRQDRSHVPARKVRPECHTAHPDPAKRGEDGGRKIAGRDFIKTRAHPRANPRRETGFGNHATGVTWTFSSLFRVGLLFPLPPITRPAKQHHERHRCSRYKSNFPSFNSDMPNSKPSPERAECHKYDSGYQKAPPWMTAITDPSEQQGGDSECENRQNEDKTFHSPLSTAGGRLVHPDFRSATQLQA